MLGIALVCDSASTQSAPPKTAGSVPAVTVTQFPSDSQDLQNDQPVRVPPAPRPPSIHAKAAILIDAVSGQVLYERNADTSLPMASTTKIMTSLLFCEHVPDDAIVTASPNACAVRESSLHLKVGEKLTAHDLLRALLLRSANDGCVAAAEKVAGSESKFVEMMNARARELGCTHTHFTNPHGLNDPEHYTSARDLARIAQAAMQQPRIREVVCLQHCRITRSINKRDVSLRNHSHFLGHFPGADGVKTGWTVPAGHCYVGSATQKHWELISVVLHSPNYVQETAELMKFGFSHFEPHVIATAGTPAGTGAVQGGIRPNIPLVITSKVQVVLRRGETTPIRSELRIAPITAPIMAGAPVGTLEAEIGNKVLCSAPVAAAEADPTVQAPAGVVRTASGGNRLLMVGSILALCLVSLRYGPRVPALAKGARRRGRRLAKSLRGDDYPG